MLGKKYQIKSAKNLENKKEETFISLNMFKILKEDIMFIFI